MYDIKTTFTYLLSTIIVKSNSKVSDFRLDLRVFDFRSLSFISAYPPISGIPPEKAQKYIPGIYLDSLKKNRETVF